MCCCGVAPGGGRRMPHKDRRGLVLPALVAVAFVVLFASYGSDAASDQPPVLNDIQSQQVDELSELTFTVTATDPNDPNGDNVYFSLAGDPPAGAVINGTTGVFSWVPTEHQDGIHVVNVTVRGGSGGTDSQVVEITVNETNSPPVLGTIWDILTFELQPLDFVVPVTDPDDPPNILTFSTSDLPDGASLDPASGAFSWTPAEDQNGLYRFNLTVSDGRGGSDSQTVSVGVLETNQPPAFDAMPDHIVSDLSMLNLNITATDPDLPANILTYSLVDPPEGANIDPRTGRFSWIPTVTDGQIDPIVVLVDDGAGGSDFVAIEIEASSGVLGQHSQSSNQRPDLDPIRPFHHHVKECSTVEFSVTASDPDEDALTFSWGNKPASVGDKKHSFTSTQSAPADTYRGDFSWTTEAVHVGSNGVQVVVSDGTLSDSAYAYVNVWQALPTFSKPTGTQTATVGKLLTVQVKATNTACNDDKIKYSLFNPGSSASGQADMDATAAHYIDEYSMPNGATVHETNGLFTWTPTKEGLYHVVVTATDGHGRFNNKVFHVDVKPPPNTPPNIRFALANPSIVDHGKTVELSGYAIDNDDGDYITNYSWSQVNPGDNSVTLTKKSSTVSTFTAPSNQVNLTFKFTAWDNRIHLGSV